MLTIVSFLWGAKYGVDDVHKLAAGVKRHLKRQYRFLCLTERERDVTFADGIERHGIKDIELTHIPGCFARLRLFDPEWQKNRRIDGPILSLDLDMVITGQIEPLFYGVEPFVILQGANASNPCPYNGSVFMLRTGAHADVWFDFSLDAAGKIPFYQFPDDQGWLAHKIPNAAGWKAGADSGIYAFQKPGWPKGEALPPDARMVVFPGWRSPEKFKRLDWIKEHWHP